MTKPLLISKLHSAAVVNPAAQPRPVTPRIPAAADGSIGQGQLARAEQLLTQGLAIRPFSEGKANLGIVLSDMGK